jgi:hypothetical protein
VIGLIVVGFVLGGGWLTYRIIESTKCSGPNAKQWATAFTQRLQESTADLATLNDSTNAAQFTSLAARAQARYTAQKNAYTPDCLSDLQIKAIQALWNEWQGYQSASVGNFDLSVTYMDNRDKTIGVLRTEFYSLSDRYKWDISNTPTP